MAAPSLFEYRAGQSLIHRLDPRAKLLLVCGLSLTLSFAGWAGSLIFTGVLAAALMKIEIPLWQMLRNFRGFFLFLGLIVLTRGLATEDLPLIRAGGFALSRPGLVQGALVALRFFDMMVLGLVFSATTRPSDLNAALQWVARPLPFVPEKRLGMIFSLALRFLPTIFRQAAETREAFLIRGGAFRKNPVQRVTILAGALMTRVLGSADDAAMAMEARCYTDERTLPPFASCGREPLVILAGIGLGLLLAWL